MPAELSEIIIGLQKVAASVVQSGRTYYRKVAEVLDERFVALLEEGQAKPDFEAMQLAMVSLVETELANLVVLDESHVVELDDDRVVRARRNAAFPVLYDRLTGIQQACEAVYGEAASVQLFGGVKDLPEEPAKLHKLGERIEHRLADPDYVIGDPTGAEPRLPGWQMSDRQQLAASVKQSADRLGLALDGLGGELKSSAMTLIEKQRSIEATGRTIRFGASCLASLYSLAGFEELARKIRPKRRAPRRPRADEAAGNGAEAAPESAPESVPQSAPESASESSSEAPAASAPAADNGDTDEPTGPTLVVS